MPLVATAHIDGSIQLHKGTLNEQSTDMTDKNLRLDFEVVTEFRDHFFPVNDLAFAKRNPWLASCANDTIVNMFDIEAGQICRSFLGGHTSLVTKCIFNHQENMVLSIGADNFLFLWDIRQNKVV